MSSRFTLRVEILTWKDAKEKIEVDCNEQRSHSALGNQATKDFASSGSFTVAGCTFGFSHST